MLKKSGKKSGFQAGGGAILQNINIHSTNFISDNPHFCKSALSRFGPRDFIALIEKHGIKYEEREVGQLFCAGSAEEIIKMLEKESNDAAVEIILNCHIIEVKKEDSFIVSTDNGIFQSGSLVIATGALSYPQIGASGMGHDIAKQFGLKVTELKPALVPFIFSRKDMTIFSELSGISIDGAIKCNKMEFREIFFLLTGDLAVLQYSRYPHTGRKVRPSLLTCCPESIYSGFSLKDDLTRAKLIFIT